MPHGRRRTFVIAAWLALLAVAMLFVAPVISKSIAHHTLREPASGVIAAHAPDGHSHMTMPDHAHNQAHPMMSAYAMSLMEEIACGYCQLLVHQPFIQFALAMLLWLMLFFVARRPPYQRIVTRISRTWSAQHARAPPVVFRSALHY